MVVVHATRSGQVAENHLVRTNTNDRTIRLKQRMNRLALLQSNDVIRHPRIGYSRVPWPRDSAEGREEEVVDGAEQDIGEGDQKKGGDKDVGVCVEGDVDREHDEKRMVVEIEGSWRVNQEKRRSCGGGDASQRSSVYDVW